MAEDREGRSEVLRMSCFEPAAMIDQTSICMDHYQCEYPIYSRVTGEVCGMSPGSGSKVRNKQAIGRTDT